MQKRRILVERIYERLDALGLSAAGASKAAGKSSTFIRDIRDRPHASPRSENLLSLAKVLQCSVAYLLGESDELGEPEEVTAGFAEPEHAVDWSPPPRRAGDNQPAFEDLVRALCAPEARPGYLRAAVTLPGFGILAGDIVVYDMKRRAAPGEIVAVSRRDEQAAVAFTVFRRFAPHPMLNEAAPALLLPSETGLAAAPELADGHVNAVRGPVIAVIRAPEIANPDNGGQ